ncbi:MAG TPA: hypothetical protein VFS11_07660 [Gemmatimonadales bacterium]|nr:hypothetical protein [Gemmatimonadales bacterium]
MAPNLWGSLLLTAVLAVPGSASAQRPVDVGTMRARAEAAQKAQGDSGKTTQSGAAAAKPAETKPAVVAAAKPAAPAAKPAAPSPAAATDSVRADSLNDPTEAHVLRESFSYSGGTRDPFASLIKSANAGPELSDLQLVGIYEDMHYSGNSVAVLREKTSGKRHKLRAGDQIGRLRVSQVRSKDVVFTISDFGYERQETLSLRKQEDVTP